MAHIKWFSFKAEPYLILWFKLLTMIVRIITG